MIFPKHILKKRIYSKCVNQGKNSFLQRNDYQTFDDKNTISSTTTSTSSNCQKNIVQSNNDQHHQPHHKNKKERRAPYYMCQSSLNQVQDEHWSIVSYQFLCCIHTSVIMNNKRFSSQSTHLIILNAFGAKLQRLRSILMNIMLQIVVLILWFKYILLIVMLIKAIW